MNPRLMRPYKEGVPASLLLRFNGTNGSTVFTDSSPNGLAMSGYGAAEISTAQSQWGGASGYFDGTALVTGPDSPLVAFGTGDFTVEAWVYVNDPPAFGAVFSSRAADHSDEANSVFLALYGSAPLLYTDTMVLQGTIAVANDTWTHIAWVRKDGVLTIYVDGVSAGSEPFTTDLTADNITVGGEADTGQSKYAGYIDDLRIVKGLAVYTGPFIPPSAPLSPYAKQVPVSREAELLLHFDGTNGSTTFTDSSVNALAVTANGDAEISTAESKWGGASGYFDGDTAYLSTPATSAIDISSSDFTMECWVYPLSLGGNNQQVVFHNSDSDNTGLMFGAQCFGNPNTLDILLGDGTSWCVLIEGDAVLVNNQWQHVAAVRFGEEYRLFVNGVIVGSATQAYSSPSYSEDATIGRFRSAQALAWDGYIDDFRIVKGLAVYTANFTPPAGPLSATVTPQ